MPKLESRAEHAAYDELSVYTLTRGDASFIHQHAVDAYAAQRATGAKPITIAFALLGLYLYLEKGYSGRGVQMAHMRYARLRKDWPRFDLPVERGSITVTEVLQAEPGTERDAAIRQWAHSVWQAWSLEHEKVAALVDQLGGW